MLGSEGGIDFSRIGKVNASSELLNDPAAEILDGALERVIQPNQTMIDLGSNSGRVEQRLDRMGIPLRVVCVEHDSEAAAKQSAQQYQHIETDQVVADAIEFVENYDGSKSDIVVLNAALHEICPVEAGTDSELRIAQQREFLKNYLSNIAKMLNEKGRLVIGDYYFSEHVTDEEISYYMDRQAKFTGHKDSAEQYFGPALVAEAAAEAGFELISGSDTQTTRKMDRRYYLLVFEKKQVE